MQQRDQPSDHHDRRTSASYALTLFLLGALTGLLSLLGRLAFELRAILLELFSAPGWWSQQRDAQARLAPLLHDLEAADSRLILAGFAVSTLALLAGVAIWVTNGHPLTQRERIWTRFTSAITVLIWAGMVSACMIVTPGIRTGAIVVTGGLSLVGLSVFVYLLVEFQFLSSAPPLPGEDPYS